MACVACGAEYPVQKFVELAKESQHPELAVIKPVTPCEQYLRDEVSAAPGQPIEKTVSPDQCPREIRCRLHVLCYRDAPKVELMARWREMPDECRSLSRTYRDDRLQARQLCREAAADIQDEPDAAVRQRMTAELAASCHDRPGTFAAACQGLEAPSPVR
jgi:hypothetical protein